MMQSITFYKHNRIYIYIYIYISIALTLFSSHKIDATSFPYIFVGGLSTSGVVINNSNTVVGALITSHASISSIAITSNNKFAYIGHLFIGGTVSVDYVNLENGSTANITSISLGFTAFGGGANTYLALTPDGNYVYAVSASSSGTSQLSVISTATNTLVAGSPFTLTGITTASGIAINPAGTKAFVTDDGSTNVLPIAITAGTGVPVIGTAFSVGAGPAGNQSLAFIPSGATVYVASSDQNLYPVNATTNAVGTGFPNGGVLGAIPTSTVIAPNGNTAYEIDNATGNVYVVNLTNQSLTTTIGMPGGTALVGAITSDGSLLYVTDTSPSVPLTDLGVTVINTASNTVSTTINASAAGDQSVSAIAIANVSSGTLDTTFGNNGFTLTPVSRADTVQNAAVRPSPYDTNEILVTGGSFTNSAISLFIGQYTASGSLDTSGFNSGGSTPGYQRLLPTGSIASTGNAVTTDSSGNVLVAGYSAQNPTAMVLARYTSAGVLDTTFPNGSGPGYALLTIGEGFTANAIGLQSSGKIIVAGTCVLNGIPLFAVARFSSAGVLDTSFGPGSTGFVTTSFGNISILKGIAIPTGGGLLDNIFAVGGVDNQVLIAQYDASGNLVRSLRQPLSTATFAPITPSSSIAYAVEWDPNTAGNDRLYIVGSAVISGVTQAVVMAYKPSTNKLEGNFRNGGNGTSGRTGGYTLQPVANGSEYFSVAVDNNGNIICGGYAIGNLANQLLLQQYLGISWGAAGVTSKTISWGYPDFYFNNDNVQLTTIGSVTAAQAVGIQSTNNIITAGTADGTFCVARFNG